MNLINFLKTLLESYGFYITPDNFVKIGEESQTVMCSGKPLVLPTKEHIESCLYTTEDGKVEIAKVLFNPIVVNDIRLESPSLNKLKSINEIIFSQLLFTAGQLILLMANNKEFQKKTNITLNEFMAKAVEIKNPQHKELVDDKMVENWAKLYMKYRDKGEYVKLFLKKLGIKDGTKFNRLAVLNIPMYEELQKEKVEAIEGVKLRVRDVNMFKLIIEFLLPEIKDKETITYGSNDDYASAFISLMMLVLKNTKKLYEVIEPLKDLDIEMYDKNITKFKITEEDVLTAYSKYKPELLLIPNENDIKVPAPVVQNPIAPVNVQSEPNVIMVNGIKLPVIKDNYQAPVVKNPVANNNQNGNPLNNYNPGTNPNVNPLLANTQPTSNFGNMNLNTYNPSQTNEVVVDPIKKVLIEQGFRPNGNNFWGGMNQSQQNTTGWLTPNQNNSNGNPLLSNGMSFSNVNVGNGFNTGNVSLGKLFQTNF